MYVFDEILLTNINFCDVINLLYRLHPYICQSFQFQARFQRRISLSWLPRERVAMGQQGQVP